MWGSPYAKLMLEGLNLLSNTELRCDPGGTQCLGVDLSGAGGVVGYFCLVGFGVYFCCLFLWAENGCSQEGIKLSNTN